MEGIYAYIERLAALALIGAACEYALPRGTLKASAKRALSLTLLLSAAEPIFAWLEAV